MKKYWIQHHRRASDDPRMKLLKETFGYAGIGVYWEIVERIETWGDGQYPRKMLIDAIRSPRVSTKMLNAILDNFYLFDYNEYDDVICHGIPLGEYLDCWLEKELKRKQREEEEQRARFEARQRWLQFQQEHQDDEPIVFTIDPSDDP